MILSLRRLTAIFVRVSERFSNLTMLSLERYMFPSVVRRITVDAAVDEASLVIPEFPLVPPHHTASYTYPSRALIWKLKSSDIFELLERVVYNFNATTKTLRRIKYFELELILLIRSCFLGFLGYFNKISNCFVLI